MIQGRCRTNDNVASFKTNIDTRVVTHSPKKMSTKQCTRDMTTHAVYDPADEKMSVDTARAIATDPARLPTVDNVQLRVISSTFSLP